jgi:hypothetical protein
VAFIADLIEKDRQPNTDTWAHLSDSIIMRAFGSAVMLLVKFFNVIQVSADFSYIEISLPGQFATSLIIPPPG